MGGWNCWTNKQDWWGAVFVAYPAKMNPEFLWKKPGIVATKRWEAPLKTYIVYKVHMTQNLGIEKSQAFRNHLDVWNFGLQDG